MSDRRLRVTWLPGSDQLRARCHCGAEHVDEDPVAAWSWLLAHPVGHDRGTGTAPAGART